MQDRGVKISMDGTGLYSDNILPERLWWTVKYEEVYLPAYLRSYNGLRPRQALGYRSPPEVFAWGVGCLRRVF